MLQILLGFCLVYATLKYFEGINKKNQYCSFYGMFTNDFSKNKGFQLHNPPPLFISRSQGPIDTPPRLSEEKNIYNPPLAADVICEYRPMFV